MAIDKAQKQAAREIEEQKTKKNEQPIYQYLLGSIILKILLIMYLCIY